MNLNKNAFPFRDVSSAEAGDIRRMWDGSRRNAGFFLEVGRQVLGNNRTLTRYLSRTVAGVLQATEAPPTEGSRACTTGILLYASVFAYAHPDANSLPAVNQAVAEVGDLESPDFLLRTSEVIGERRTFHGLVDEMATLLGDANRFGELAVIGAGAVHLVVEETDRRMSEFTAFEADLGFDPGLEELFKRFDV